ncbi:heterokaryon incompatibility protein [Grosmannia clavigera kw1407]|uniref:Heterokaryon incompatibility protein n=1 Tax=Grosmannia clavigera (strain kw1407 / UAMH 11150) TaxID=655863 RepID=F0XDR6_GROCL|nr:heterokaryon incompatibility protein [Grosmannia clavigera kw1407]EFX03814.1 heterokaryon incompatibility protein [Grosmannia clavigera kw1407]
MASLASVQLGLLGSGAHSFRRSSLSVVASSIRALNRQSSGRPARVHGVRLSEGPIYEAVSYVWGSSQKPARISCDGSDLAITANIDAGEPVERGYQVAMMGDIYRHAAATVIVLGTDPSGHTPRLAALVADLDPRWPSYTALFDSPWFDRVWTAQESALSRKPLILWGDTQIAWADIIGVHRWLVMHAQRIWFRHRLMLNDVHELSFWRPLWHMPNSVELLCRAKTLDCSDDRDRIFAFLSSAKAYVVVGGDGEGVGSDKGTLNTRTNYRKPFREVYRDFAADWLLKTGNLCLLSAVEHTSDTFADPIVPTWAPRWDVCPTGSSYGLFDPGCNASNGLGAVRPVLDSQTKQPKLRGIVCDTVVRCWPRRSASPTGADVLTAAWKYLSSDAAPFAYEDRSQLQAFAQLLCRQKYHETGAPDELHADEAAFAPAMCRATGCFGDVNEASLETSTQVGRIEDFLIKTGIWAVRRRLVLTHDGRYVLASRVAQEGDKLCVLAGMKVPVILRKEEQQDCCKLVGEAFVLGMMNGEAVDRALKCGTATEDIILC